jgi:hypothetical protein
MSRNALSSRNSRNTLAGRKRRLRLENLERRELLAATTVLQTAAPVTLTNQTTIPGIPANLISYTVITTIDKGSSLTLNNTATNGAKTGTFDIKGALTIEENIGGMSIPLLNNWAFEEKGNLSETVATKYVTATGVDTLLGNIALSGTTSSTATGMNASQTLKFTDITPDCFGPFALPSSLSLKFTS